jgi:hypothetical protein
VSDQDVVRALLQEDYRKRQSKEDHVVAVGSRALKWWYSDYPYEVTETDYMYLNSVPVGEKRFLPDPGIYYDVSKRPGMKELYSSSVFPVLKPESLYTLYLSRCFWNVRWQSTMKNISFLQGKNIKPDFKLYKLLIEDWRSILGSRRQYYLGAGTVNKIYKHESLHNVVSIYKNPLYLKIKQGPSAGWTSEDMFRNLPKYDQINLCREEIFATALEQFLIPQNFEITPLTAYNSACKLLLTRLTSGWFPLFIALNWKELSVYDGYPYVDQFFHERAHGRIEKVGRR